MFKEMSILCAGLILWLGQHIIHLTLIAFFCSGILFWLGPHLPQIVTVDVTALTEQFIKHEAGKQLSIKEKKKAIRIFSHALEEALNELTHTQSVIVFPKEAVLKGAKDYTPRVKQIMHWESLS